MKYKTKIDLLPALFLGSMLTFSLIGGLVVLLSGQHILLGMSGILCGLALLAISTPTQYRLRERERELEIRSGLFRWCLPTARIQQVQYSSNPLFAPAWSLKRLRIDFLNKKNQKDYLLISPADRFAFMKELLHLEPELVRNGERLERLARL